MSDITSIPSTTASYTYGRDEYGEFGSLVEPESELHVPEPLDLAPSSPFAESEL